MILLKSLKFWSLVAGLLLFVAQAYAPDFPLDENSVLKIVLLILGALHIEPEIRASLK